MYLSVENLKEIADRAEDKPATGLVNTKDKA